jgi:hypothetical protein
MLNHRVAAGLLGAYEHAMREDELALRHGCFDARRRRHAAAPARALKRTMSPWVRAAAGGARAHTTSWSNGGASVEAAGRLPGAAGRVS